MTIKILLITANIGNYDRPFYDVPEELSGVQLLRICDFRQRRFSSITRIPSPFSSKTKFISSRLISRIPKINPFFLLMPVSIRPHFSPPVRAP